MRAGTLALSSKSERPPVPRGGPYLADLDKPDSTLLSLGGLAPTLTLARVLPRQHSNVRVLVEQKCSPSDRLGLGARRGSGIAYRGSYTATRTRILTL